MELKTCVLENLFLLKFEPLINLIGMKAPRLLRPFIVLLEMKKLNTQEPEALLAKFPTHLKGISCVCNACISRYLQ